MKLMSLYIPLNTNQYSDNSQANENAICVIFGWLQKANWKINSREKNSVAIKILIA